MNNSPDDPKQYIEEAEDQTHPVTNRGGRPARSAPEPVKWTIRGVEPETRRVIEKAADRTGKTLGQFFNHEIREAAVAVIKKGDQPPARPEDLISDLFEKLKLDLKNNQSTELQSIREAIEKRPTSLREWLFGKK